MKTGKPKTKCQAKDCKKTGTVKEPMGMYCSKHAAEVRQVFAQLKQMTQSLCTECNDTGEVDGEICPMCDGLA